jgi:iron complex transport system permease protein
VTPSPAPMVASARPWLSPQRIYALLFALLGGIAFASLRIGAGDLSDASLSQTFLSLRAARLFAALLSGAALAVAGVVVQGLFRNPLADPSILGTTAGASLGGRVTILLTQALLGTTAGSLVAPELLLPVGCMLGACGALALVLAVHRTGDDIVVLLLTGFLLSSLFLSLGSFVASLALERWELSRALMDFALGDLSGVSMRRVLLAAPMVLSGLVAAYFWSSPLDVMLTGEDEAASLGVDVHEVRRACVLWTAVLSAAAVAVGGNVGFVGLIVPHALRPLVGVTHRRLIPASALLGALFVAACDVLTRILPTRSEVPLGVVTGLLGAPIFLVLLLRSRREVRNG